MARATVAAGGTPVRVGRSARSDQAQPGEFPSLWVRIGTRHWVSVRWSPYSRSVTPKLADYIEAGKALDADERLEAAHQLLLSVDRDVDATEAEVASSWDETIDRRVEEIVSGDAEFVEGREAHARVRAEIAAPCR
jgi:hypothetical protein